MGINYTFRGRHHENNFKEKKAVMCNHFSCNIVYWRVCNHRHTAICDYKWKAIFNVFKRIDVK